MNERKLLIELSKEILERKKERTKERKNERKKERIPRIKYCLNFLFYVQCINIFAQTPVELLT